MDNKKLLSCSNTKRFICEYCHYNTSKKSSWRKHIKTNKHLSKSLSNMDNGKVAPRFFCECGKKYQFKSGLCKHKKKCLKICGNNLKKGTTLFEKKIYKEKKLEKMENSHNNPEINSLKEELNDIKYLMKQFITQSTENHTKTSTLIESQINSTKAQQTIYNNCNNQNMTINVFLNEQCKDALNLSDFVQNIKVTLEDLQYTKDNGFVNGVTNIITKQLQDLAPTQRPIHCSDKKRLHFYVKDDDTWKKDENNKKLDDAILDVKLKLPKSLTEWEKMNPSYKKDPKLMDEWMNIMAGISESDTGNVLKDKLVLKRKIATYIELKEAMATDKEK